MIISRPSQITTALVCEIRPKARLQPGYGRHAPADEASTALGEHTMKVEVKDGQLVISIPMQQPAPSASGKTLVVASTHGNIKTSAMVDGKPITIGLNAYIHR